jgi:hypothetical protein
MQPFAKNCRGGLLEGKSESVRLAASGTDYASLKRGEEEQNTLSQAAPPKYHRSRGSRNVVDGRW